ncbi:hypothetical protein [Aureispira sp. CCB-E]|uniref:hypothetical protein n=1 Tax=Aureispira sp. CCB-E TaxID=3051121 RepID=UPI0028697BB3|nr:hypothetical protein [Aureispira sp. CCB-E]WMX15403.1 hypothetical protein QP953_03320 [Aureispira sp. CCB-E]
MRHQLILLFYGLVIISSLVGAYIFIGYHTTKQTDFTTKEGVVQGVLMISKDEYGEDVGLRFRLEDSDVEYVLAGKLLEITHPDIHQLKEGDSIRVWVKTVAAQNFLDKSMAHMNAIWGIQRLTDGLILLALEDAIHQRSGLQYLGFVVLFILTASVFSFFFYRKVKLHKK